jgi:processive 1,2-diacylglycerol beta-glucosyltransferase
MNVIVLTARFGMGHYKVAEAIKEDMEAGNSSVNVKVIDFMSFLFPRFNGLIYKGYDKLVFKNSRLYNAIGKVSNDVKGIPMKFVVASRVSKLIKDSQADVVIVAFPLCSQYISEYKKLTGDTIPMYTCITDIPAHTEWIAEETNLYFISSEETREMLLQRGVDQQKIVVTGIPVRKEFKDPEADLQDTGKKNILVMGGGLGLLPGGDLLLNRLSELENVQVTLVAGKNEELRADMSRRYPGFETIGFTDKIGELMKRADAIVTKPGGVTLSEAVHTGTPLYIVNPFLLQEIGNAKFIEKHHIGRVVWKEEDATADDIEKFVCDDAALKEMKQNMADMVREYSQHDMASEIDYDLDGEVLKCS